MIVHKFICLEAPESLKSMIVITNIRTYKLLEREYKTVYGMRAFSRSGPKDTYVTSINPKVPY